MQNLYSLTDFIRALKIKPLGFSSVYLVEQGKAYRTTCKALTATAGRENLKISTTQLMLVDPATLTTIEAIKVTVK